METVIVERDGGVVTVTLNRPERKNAGNPTMWVELETVFGEIGANPDDRVMVLTGAGGSFCSGADLSHTPADAKSPLSRMRQLGAVALALNRIPQPTIAKVRGVAVGAGCNLALGCDLVVASEDARFSEIFSRRGLSIDCGGSWILPRLIGLHRAKEVAFFAEMLSARDAAELGLVNRVVAAAELDALVEDWARRLAAGPPIALSMTKTMLNNSAALSIGQAVEDEARCQVVNFSTADTAEALRAFAERREPRFQGH